MRIGLIRHGETAWNAQGLLQGISDIPLNPLGRSQAVSAGRMIAGQGWQVLYASPLQRAMESARLLAAEAGLPEPIELPGVIERAFGELEGTSYWQPDGTRAPLDHPSVEPIEAVVERSVATIREVAARHPMENVLVVAHGTVIRNVLDRFMVEDAPGVTNLSLSVLVPKGDGFEVVLANGYPRFPLDEVHAVARAAEDARKRCETGAETPDAQEPGA
ncbi:Putative phosphoserine phosphatase 2 [Pseudoclavibacter triregionum]|nr:Putative phosphoserine phosphatase 2 [Pseudoclavibacter triregionum]